MFNIFKKNRKNDDRFPRVVYYNNTVRREIEEWVRFMHCNSFGEVLFNIGFNKDDVIYLYKDVTKRLTFYYSVNDSKVDLDNNISISYGSLFEEPSSIIKRTMFDIKKYEKDDIFELREYEKIISDNVSYKRCYFDFSALFYVKINDYKLSLVIYRNFDNKDTYFLNNEDKLIEYLTGLTLPISIVDVYKKICEICSLDVSKCDEFKLSISKLTDDKKNKEEITDIIQLNNGEFKKFGMTKDGKKIILYHDGSWSYKVIDGDSLVKFSMDVKDGNINYNILSSNDNEIDNYIEKCAVYDINNVRSEIGNAKKLVRTIFNEKRD